jgi:protein-tyrosine phosphatase
VIDLHTHVLPGLDDGPQELEESLSIVSFLAGLGFDHIFLTPHFRQSYFETPVSRIREASGQLRAARGDSLPAVRFTEAHEVHLGSVFDSHGKVQGFLTFGGSQRHVLLELPRQPFPFEFLFRTVDRLFVEGIRVVLAHPERYMELSSQPARYRELCERGVKLQLNLTSLSGFAGRQVRKAAEALCGEGMVHAVGTDAHSLAQVVEFVPRGMQRAMKLLGEKRLRAIAEGAELPLAG